MFVLQRNFAPINVECMHSFRVNKGCAYMFQTKCTDYVGSFRFFLNRLVVFSSCISDTSFTEFALWSNSVIYIYIRDTWLTCWSFSVCFCPFWYWCYYLHRLRDSVTPLIRIFSYHVDLAQLIKRPSVAGLFYKQACDSLIL